MKLLASTLLMGLLLVNVAASHADTPKPVKVKAPKTPVVATQLTDVNVCPMTGESSKGSKLALRYKQYNVRFCCPGCDAEFAKLSPGAKEKKIASALKAQKSAKA